jgi:hypothetical protein
VVERDSELEPKMRKTRTGRLQPPGFELPQAVPLAQREFDDQLAVLLTVAGLMSKQALTLSMGLTS